MASSKEVDRTIDQQQQHDQDQQKPGVIGSVMKAVHDTYENARDAVVGKRDPATHSHTTTTEVIHIPGDDDDDGLAGEVRDISADKSRGIYDSTFNDRAGPNADEYANRTAQKAKETKDATKEKTMEYADYAGDKAKEAKDKAGEYKDCAAEKAKEGKDATVNKMGEYKDYTVEKAKEGKDSAADAAKRAMGYLGDKKEETKQKAAETTDAAKHKTAEATRDRTKDMEEEARRKVEGGRFREESWRRGNEGVIKAEDTRAGAVAEKLRASDQMAGQAFNDVGPMDDEGVTRVGLLDIKK